MEELLVYAESYTRQNDIFNKDIILKYKDKWYRYESEGSEIKFLSGGYFCYIYPIDDNKEIEKYYQNFKPVSTSIEWLEECVEKYLKNNNNFVYGVIS